MEAAYLARQAGFEIALIDKDPFAPACSLVEHFHHLDVVREGDAAKKLLKEFDLIVPATENIQTLSWLDSTARLSHVPLALDLPSYTISSSKIKSNQLIVRAGIPIPEPWPNCGFPVIFKPSGLSGSTGVVKVKDHARLKAIVADSRDEAVIQEYLNGPSYSLEVLAHQGTCSGMQVTKLEFDEGYDCKRVLAGPNIGDDIADAFYDIGERIAAALALSGIMDIEVIDTAKELKVLEIDARLPSQTPSAVYHSTGVNMVKLLADYWIDGTLPAMGPVTGVKRAVIYEHFRLRRGVLEVAGEHVLAEAQGLKLYDDMFSTDALISNFERSPEDWVATAIFIRDTEPQVWEARNQAIQHIQQKFKASAFLDPDTLD